MKLFYILTAILPLALAKPRCECAVPRCPGDQPALCQCEKAAAIACANQCGGTPTLKPCPIGPPTATTAPPHPTPTLCGSRGMPPCASNQYCIADPNNLSCSLVADCPGFCVQLDGPACSGIAGLGCPSVDQYCVDVPGDDCDPGNGGADCGGICVKLDGGSSATTA